MTISLGGWGTGAIPTLGWGLGGFVEGLAFGLWPDIGIYTEIFEPEIQAIQVTPYASATRGPISDVTADSLAPSIAANAFASLDVTAFRSDRPSVTIDGVRPHIAAAQLRTGDKTGTLLSSQEAKEGLRPSINTDIEEIG